MPAGEPQRLALVPRPFGALDQQEQKDRFKKKREAWDLRVAGASIEDIADRLGVSASLISRWIKDVGKEIAKAEDKDPAAKRRMAVARAERVQLETYGLILNPKVPIMLRIEATKQWWKGQDHIAKLEGTYAPTKIASTTPSGDRWAPFLPALAKMSTEELKWLLKANDAYLESGGEPIDVEVQDVTEDTGTE